MIQEFIWRSFIEGWALGFLTGITIGIIAYTGKGK
jgi:hypothetical protein